MAKSTEARACAPDEVLAFEREFDAPLALVWKLWKDPEHMVRWHGPEGYWLTHCEIDFRVGGKWRFVGRGPHGEGPAFYGEYREIGLPDRIVFTEIFEPFPDAESVITAVFTEEGGKTRLTVTCLYPSRDVRDMVIKTGMEKGAAISYDGLEEVAQSLRRP